ncbi:MAG: enoyl-CoA hydratase/isomerase family protein [Salinirussus sp.]
MSVSLERESDRPHVAHLRLDTGDLNLFDADIAASFRETVHSVPEEISVLTITAPQPDDGVRGLSAGLNLEYAHDLGPHDGQDLLREFYEMIEAVRDCDAVAVCGCGDYTLGVAFELAAACEFRIATADANLGLPEVDIGLPTVIQGGLVLDLVGRGVANELIYAADILDGERARELGVVTRAPQASNYEETFGSFIDDLAGKSPTVLRSQKRVLRRCRSNGLESGMEASIGDAGRGFGGQAQREGMAAFLEDREPDWT